MYSKDKVRPLVEGAMMCALATVLSIIKIVEMPYGGSVTVASMLPMVILAYRHGTLWGLGSGLVYAALQQLLGLNSLSYVTGWQSIVAVIMLDYILAFTFVGFAGIFRRVSKKQSTALASGAAFISLLRFICHIISGATVWAGLSIPDSAALIYSIGYNATYMIPETVILVATAYYLGGAVDFSADVPRRVIHTSDPKAPLRLLSGAILIVGAVADITLIAPHLQDGETGAFSILGLRDVSWVTVAVISAISLVSALLLFIRSKRASDSQ